MKYAFRSLLKTPGFSIVALVTLALGIGVNTSMYTLVDVLLFRTVPFAEPERLVSILGTGPRSQRDSFSFNELSEVQAQAMGPGKAFESITLYAGWSNTWSDPGRPAERLFAIDATADLFATFRVQPILGRAFTAEECTPGRNQVALLSHSAWQRRFGGDPGVIGRTVRLNAEQVTIIGVMPASFAAPLFFGPVDLWRPITIPRFIVEDRNNRFFNAVGRLNPGVTPGQALAQLAPLAANWAKDYPQTSKDRGFNLLPPHKAAMDDASNFIIWLLFGLGCAVLLVACANIANLQLARATANVRDLAIRSALGATRARLIRHQLTESLVLAVAGGLLGLMVALWLNAAFGSAIRLGADPANTLALPMNARVLGGAFLVSLGTGLLFGLLPAWFASRDDVVATLKQQTRSSTSGAGPRLMRQALIVGEVAVALALLGAAGIMIRGLDQLMRRDKGWDTDKILAANIHLPEQSTYADPAKRRLAIERLARRIAEIPGAEHTVVSTSALTFGYSKVNPIHVEGQDETDPAKLPTAGFIMVTPGFFATLGVPLLEGRDFPADINGDSPPVVVIGETMARKLWPGQSAIGKRIAEHSGANVEWREVIGVARDIQFALDIGNPPTPFQVYKPAAHETWGYQWLLLRAQAPGSLKNEVRKAVADIDPDVAVQELLTIPEATERYQHNLVVINNTLGGFALLGLVLAAVGLYGVISYLVAQRTGEFGIRLALGASPGDVLGLVLRSGLVLTLIGLALGVVGTFALNRALGAAMPRLAATDPLTIAGTAVALFLVALFACFLPARRATKVDPLVALRAD